MRPKVFISSTFVDLVDHRKQVWNLLKHYNVDVLGMEGFGARTSKPLQTCLDEVNHSDIFIGIIGMRYGSVDKSTAKSFTLLEYEQAVKNGCEVFIYLIDEAKGLVHPAHIDFQNHQKLKQFKSNLQDEHTCEWFVNSKELVEKINKRLKSVAPGKRIRRPRSIECEITKFKIGGEDWFIAVGYVFGQPMELYLGKREAFYLPKYVAKGHISKRNHKNQLGKQSVVFDLTFMDPYGYKVTVEGVSAISFGNTKVIEKLVNKFLTDRVPPTTIIDLLPIEVAFEDKRKMGDLKRGLRKALVK